MITDIFFLHFLPVFCPRSGLKEKSQSPLGGRLGLKRSAGSHLGRGSRRRGSPGNAVFFLWATEPALREAGGKIIAAAGRDSIRGLRLLSVDRAGPADRG